MNTKSARSLALAAMLPFIQGFQPACAQLPMLEQPWLGYFAVADEGKFRFRMAASGGSEILVVNKGGDPIEACPITLHFLATEILPDGGVRELPMKLDTLESTDLPSAKLKKTVFRGKLTEQATGQPTLEVTIENSSGNILANARITDKGAFGQNPLRPVIRVVFPRFYANEYATREALDKKQIREFEKRISRDSVTLKHINGNRVKLECVGATDTKKSEVNGAGSSSVEIEIGEYQRKIEFLAAPNSLLTLGNASPAPLHNGFWLQWSADPAKDPNNTAKLAIRVK